MHPPVTLSRAARVRRRRPSSPRRGRVQSPSPARPLSVFVAYGTVLAAREALTQFAASLGSAQPTFRLQPMFWRLDQLDRPSWREMALRDASRAAAIVLALGDGTSLSVDAERWLANLARREPRVSVTAFVTLHDEIWTLALEQVATPATLPAEVPKENPATFTTLPDKKTAAQAA